MSTVVDERVVSMSFDNSQFDVNVQDSINSLDRLKESLKFSEAKNSFKGLNNAANSVNLSGIERSLDKIQKRFSTTGIIGMTMIQNLTTGAMNMAKKTTHWFTQGVVQGGLARAKNIEQAKFQLKGLKVEWDAIKDDINFGVEGTAYGLDSAAKAASQLVASSVQLGDEMKTSLRAISGVAAMTNSSYDDIAHIFTTVAGQGKLGTEQLNQLAGRGLNVAATIAEVKHTTEKDVRDMVKDSKISFMEFAETMDYAFGTHAKDANKTFTGALSNTKAALGRIGAEFFTPFIRDEGPLVNFFNRVKNIIDNVKKALVPIEDEFLAPAIGLVDKLTQYLANLDHVTGNTFRRFEHIINSAGIESKVFEKNLTDVLKGQGVDTDSLIKKYGSLADAVDNLDSTTRQTSLDTAFRKTLNVIDPLEKRMGVFKTTIDDVEKSYGMLNADNKEGIKALEEQGFNYKELSKLIDTYHQNGKITLDDLNKKTVMALGLSAKQALGFRQLEAGAEKAGLSLGTYMDNLEHMEKNGSGGVLILDTIRNAFTALLKPLKAVGQGFLTAMNFNPETGLYDLIVTINRFSQTLIMSDETAENIKNTFTGLFTVARALAKIVGGALMIALYGLSTVLKITGGGIFEITGNFGDLLNTIRKKASGPLKSSISLFSRLKNVVTSFAEVLKAKVDKYVGIVSNKIDYARSKIDWLVNGLYKYLIANNFLQAGLSYVTNQLKEMFKRVTNVGRGLLFISGTTKALEKFGNRMKTAGTIVKMFVDQSVAKVKQFLAAFKSVEHFDEKGFELFAKIFHEKVVKYVCDPKRWRVVGTALIEGFINGIVEVAEGIITIMEWLGEMILNAIKNKLGIHSPSTETREIGHNLIEGLILGLKDMFGELINAIESIVGGVIRAFQSINFGKVLAAGGALGGLVILNKLLKTFKAIKSPFDVFNGLMGAASSFLKEMAKVAKGGQLLLLVSSITALSLAIAILANVPTDKLLISVAAIGVLIFMISRLITVLDKVKPVEIEVKMTALAMFAGGMAALILALAAALAIASRIEHMGRAVLGVAAVAGAMVAIIYAIDKMAKNPTTIRNAIAFTIMLTGLVGSLVTLSMAIVALSKIPPENLKTVGLIIGGVIAILASFAGITYLTKKFSVSLEKKMLEMAAVFAALGFAFGSIAFALTTIANIEQEDLNRALLVVAGLAGLMIVTTVLSNLAGQFGKEAAITFIGFGAAVGLLAWSIKELANIDGDLNQATSVITKLALFMGLMVAVSKIGGSSAKTAAGLMVGVALTVFAIAVSIKMLSSIPVTSLVKAVAVVTWITLVSTAMVAGLMIVMNVLQVNAKGGGLKAGMMMVGVAVTLLAMAGAIALLSMIDGPSLAKATAALTTVILAVSLVIYMIAKTQDMENPGKAFQMLITITVMLGVLGASLIALAMLPLPNVLAAMAAMTAVIGSFAVLLVVAKKFEGNVFAIAVMVAAIWALGEALSKVAKLPFKNIIAAGVALSAVLITFAVAITAAAKLLKTAIGGLIVISVLFIAVMAAIGYFFYQLQQYDVKPAKETVTAIIEMLLAFTGVLVVLTVVGAMAPAAAAGVALFYKFIIELMVFFAAIGLIIDKLPIIEKFVTKGITLLIKMANGIGQMIGSFIGGIAEGVSNSLPKISENLSKFLINVLPLMMAVSSVDPKAAESAKNIADALYTIMGIANNQTLAGDMNFDNMKGACKSLGECLDEFNNSLDSLDEQALNKITLASKAIKRLTELDPNNSGGLAWLIMGDNTLDGFGKQLPMLGEGLSSFADSLSGVDESALNKIKLAADAVEALTQLDPNNTKGLVSLFTGDNKLNDFGRQLEGFGKGIKDFADATSGIDPDSVKLAAKAAGALVEATSGLSINVTVFENFTKNIDQVGEGMKEFYGATSNIDVAIMEAVILQTKQLVKLLKSMSDLKGDEADGFRDAIKSMATTGFDDAIKAINTKKGDLAKALKDAFNGAIDGANKSDKTVNFAAKFEVSLTESIGTIEGYKEQFKKTGASISKAFTSGFNGSKVGIGASIKNSLKETLSAMKEYKSKFKTVGQNISKAFTEGFTNTKSKGVATNMTNAVKNAKNKVDAYKTDFQTVGKHLVQGLAKGITDNQSKAVDAAVKVAKKSLKAAKQALDINSPSREMMKVGAYFVEGYAKGINRNVAMAVESSSDMAMQTLNAVSAALNEMDDMAADPVITPVVDLSNAIAASSSINSMFTRQQALGISAAFESRITPQEKLMNRLNDGFSKIVDRFDDISTNSYTINGITYDDGSNITSAVESLVHAVKVEGRA